MNTEPKYVFISYCWTSNEYQYFVQNIADRLIADGIQVIIDIYDLKEGNDKHHFMEKMVNDSKINHVLIMCNKGYKDRADTRKSGVGTETQIISKEIYEKTGQSKFIPIICEKDEIGNAYTPTYLSSIIYIDFSSEQNLNENWEQLVRLIYGKPLFKKPQLGKKPSYLSEESSTPSSPIKTKLSLLKQAITTNKNSQAAYREEFINECFLCVDNLRVRSRPTVHTGQLIIDTYVKLTPIRNYMIDWLILEITYNPTLDLFTYLEYILEKFAEFRLVPNELSSYQDGWSDGHSLFLIDFIYYLVAILIKYNKFDLINKILLEKYYIYDFYTYKKEHKDFSTFYYGNNNYINQYLDKNYYSAVAELIQRNVTNPSISLDNLIEADLLILLVALVNTTRIKYWYPQMQHYNKRSQIELFSRAEKQSWFSKITTATGVLDRNILETKAKEGINGLNNSTYSSYRYSLSSLLNLDHLGTID